MPSGWGVEVCFSLLPTTRLGSKSGAQNRAGVPLWSCACVLPPTQTQQDSHLTAGRAVQAAACTLPWFWGVGSLCLQEEFCSPGLCQAAQIPSPSSTHPQKSPSRTGQHQTSCRAWTGFLKALTLVPAGRHEADGPLTAPRATRG